MISVIVIGSPKMNIMMISGITSANASESHSGFHTLADPYAPQSCSSVLDVL